jgi:NADH-quinone oxidoreductase subunit A
MTASTFDYANILVFLGLGAVLCGLFLGLGSLLRPHNPGRAKNTTYECGEEVEGDSWINFNIRFYVMALVFVIFDVEVAFIYPVVTVFRDFVADGRGALALAEVGLFVAILAVGLVYILVRGDLEWIKRVAGDEPRTLDTAGSGRSHVAG